MHRVELLLVAWLCVSAINAFRPVWPVEFWLNAKWAPLFIAGSTFFLIRTQGISLLRGALIFASWVLSINYAIREIESYPLVNPWICSIIITIFFTIFLTIAFDRWHMAASKFTKTAGALTYPVYVIHQNFGYMLYELFREKIFNTPLALGITILIVLLLGWAIHQFIEKTLGPLIRRWISGTPALTPSR
jgi:peptidoglycan/LPS O-acetylase OafA/YrhL